MTGIGDLETLLETIDLERVSDNNYLGHTPPTQLRAIFGGQVAAQALMAAGRETPPDRQVHSLHSYFVRPGVQDLPITFRVERIRDGGSFSVRRVVAEQNDDAIYVMSASFQLPQPGVEHQRSMPSAPAPERLPTVDELTVGIPELEAFWKALPQPFDIRFVTDPTWTQHGLGAAEEANSMAWIRARAPVGADPLLNACLLTFASDINILDPVLLSHGLDPRLDPIVMASLDHAIWFHRQFRADDWLLFSGESATASAGRGLGSGRYFSRDGRLVASVVQEGLMRFASS